MKKVAKALSIVLVLVLFAAMAAGSGSSESKQEEKAASSVSTNTQETETVSEAPAASNEKKADSKAVVIIEEAVLLDQDGIKITAKSFDAKGLFGPSIKMLFENNSDKNVTVQTRNESVNGYMVDTMLSVELAAGKKANDSLTLMTSDLELAGITTIADIEFSFHVFESESWDTIFDSQPITIQTSAAEGFTYTFDNSGEQVYNSNGIEIVVKGLSEKDSWLGKEIVVYASNNTDKSITIQTRDTSINGFMVEPYFSCDIAAGKHAVSTITFASSDLEENDIQAIETAEISFHIFDSDTWNTIQDTTAITLNFN